MRLLMPVGISGWAIAASYLGLVSVLLLPAPFALVTGILAVRDIRRTRGTAKQNYGMVRAVFGILMGSVFTLVAIPVIARVLSAA